MSKVKTYQDQTSFGTFSQIKLDDGNKILISLTQTEIAIFKLGFLKLFNKVIWKYNIYDFLDFIYTEGPNSKNFDKSVLEISVTLAKECKSIEEIKEKFNNLIK